MLNKKQENHKKIKSEKDLTEFQAERLVKKFIKENAYFANGLIYIDCPDISDLFIIKEYKIRKCTDKEWADYFNTYIGVREQKPRKYTKRN